MHFVRFEGSMMRKQAVKCELKNVDITQTFNFKLVHLFGTETTLCVYFTILENVTFKKNKKDRNKLKIPIVHWVCCSKS